MASNTKIEWCDHTFNPWTGCTKVSPGCGNCYAEGWSKRSGIVTWGPGHPRRRTSEANWKLPLKWNRDAAREHLPKFFAASNKLDRIQKDGQAFRKLARETFEYTAPVFINACLQRDKAGIPKSRTIIAWDNVKPLDHVPA